MWCVFQHISCQLYVSECLLPWQRFDFNFSLVCLEFLVVIKSNCPRTPVVLCSIYGVIAAWLGALTIAILTMRAAASQQSLTVDCLLAHFDSVNFKGIMSYLTFDQIKIEAHPDEQQYRVERANRDVGISSFMIFHLSSIHSNPDIDRWLWARFSNNKSQRHLAHFWSFLV